MRDEDPNLRVWVRTERGWPGHFILGSRCVWHRNTLLEQMWPNNAARPSRRMVVSSIGNCRERDGADKMMTLGISGHVMETMCFLAERQDPYWEANIMRQLPRPGGMAWWSKNQTRDATEEWEEIHEKHLNYWGTVMQTAVDTAWYEITKRSDERPQQLGEAR